ncbi:MAG: tetratricopeptide repeat protein [Anaerolineae bacterium]
MGYNNNGEVTTVASDRFVNPYIVGNPLKTPEMFYGREDIFHHIQEHLAGRYQDNLLVLYGQKRTGKTSVLYQIINRQLLGDRYVPVYINLQGLTQPGMKGLLHDLATEISHSVDLPDPAREQFSPDPGGFFKRDFLDGVIEAIGGRCLLLMVDEYEVLEDKVKAGKLEEEFFPYLRYLMQDRENLGFIFAGSRKLEEMDPRLWSIFRNTLYRKISFLEKEETRRLITEPVDGVMTYDYAAVEAIYQATFGHPYFTQLYCHHLVSRYWTKAGPITVADVEAASLLAETIEASEPQLHVMWDETTDEEKVVLAAMSIATARQRTAPPSTLANVLARYRARIGQRDLNRALGGLVTRDVLLIEEGFNYRFAVDLFQRWVGQTQRLESLLEELGLAAAYEEQGKQQAALRGYEQVLAVDPSCVEAFNALGHLHYQQEELNRALKAYRQALKLEPDNAVAASAAMELHYQLGLRYFKARQWQQALDHFRQLDGAQAAAFPDVASKIAEAERRLRRPPGEVPSARPRWAALTIVAVGFVAMLIAVLLLSGSESPTPTPAVTLPLPEKLLVTASVKYRISTEDTETQRVYVRVTDEEEQAVEGAQV